ncbi:hypothetical protein [Streptomyces sp. NPDC088400]|uniref:hypothetical protein n=1 Tax=Streptomyces sp. NPDC088400 TaxID=3365861 RepID=UPI0037F66645
MNESDKRTARAASRKVDARKEADDAVRTLKDALVAAGIVLPSLRADPAGPVCGVVLVELGGARPDVVRKLAAAVKKGADK